MAAACVSFLLSAGSKPDQLRGLLFSLDWLIALSLVAVPALMKKLTMLEDGIEFKYILSENKIVNV